MPTAGFGRLLRAGLALLLLVALAGCEVRTELNVAVEDDGSGQLEVAVALDDDAVSRRPGLLEELDLSDLTDTGWEITGPAEEADGHTWIRAGHDFGTPEELGTLVDEVAGEDGPFQDFRLVQEDVFAERHHRFAGTVDLTSGAGAFAQDPELAEALGAEPIELLEQRLGASIDDMVQVEVTVRMPGEVDSNALLQSSNGAVWRPSVAEGEVVELRATSTISRSDRLVWAGVAAGAGLALVLYLLFRVVAWRRSRRRATPANP